MEEEVKEFNIDDYTDEELLRLASLSAAASLGAADAVGGMLPLSELSSLEKRFGRKELL